MVGWRVGKPKSWHYREREPMRQGQQNRRGRGRNRKSQNPLTRSFESNGPDIKIRGTPSHIAEKYISLARDAQSSGDPVLAENYLQHAEHYNRIIMAFREQHMQQGGDAQSGMIRRPQSIGELVDADDFGDDEGDDGGMEMPGVMGMNEPQPNIRGYEGPGRGAEGERRENPRQEGRGEGGRQDQPRGEHQPRHERRGRGDFVPRHQRERHQGANGQSRGSDDQPQQQNGMHRGGQQGGSPQGGPAQRAEGGGGGGRRNDNMRRRDQFAAGDEQPEFLRRPIRRQRREDVEGTAEEAPPAAASPVNAEDKVE